MHVTNTMNHTMGDLSAQAAILACEGDDDTPSKLVCMHFSCWDNVKEWSVSMPDGEDIVVNTTIMRFSLVAECTLIMVPTWTGKMGKHFPFREFLT